MQQQQILDEIKAILDKLSDHEFTDADLNILSQLRFQAERSARWITMTPEMMAMPKTIDGQELERRTYQLVGQRQPTMIGGKPID